MIQNNSSISRFNHKTQGGWQFLGSINLNGCGSKTMDHAKNEENSLREANA